jgi:hypothetical protein
MTKLVDEEEQLKELLDQIQGRVNHINYVINQNISMQVISNLPPGVSYVHGISNYNCEIATEHVTFIYSIQKKEWSICIFESTDYNYRIIVPQENNYEPWVSYEKLLEECNKSLHYRAAFWDKRQLYLNPTQIKIDDIKQALLQDNSHYILLPFKVLVKK